MMRLQKLLSVHGVASRRAAEKMILAGRVTVAGRVAGLGDSALPEQVCVDGLPLTDRPAPVVVMYYKPLGVVTTLKDEKGRRDLSSLVPEIRLVPVGRLDVNSEGLLLLTNDGELVYRLTHPSFEVQKEYHVWVKERADAVLDELAQPMWMDGALTRPAQVKSLPDGVLSVIIHEGRNRQVRRMCARVGLTVVRLCRVAEGPLRLSGLRPGQWRHLTETELSALRGL